MVTPMITPLDQEQSINSSQIVWKTNALYIPEVKEKEVKLDPLSLISGSKEPISFPPLKERPPVIIITPSPGEMEGKKVSILNEKNAVIELGKKLGSLILDGVCAIGSFLWSSAKVIAAIAAAIIGVGLMFLVADLVAFAFVGFIMGPTLASITELLTISSIIAGFSTVIAIPLCLADACG